MRCSFYGGLSEAAAKRIENQTTKEAERGGRREKRECMGDHSNAECVMCRITVHWRTLKRPLEKYLHDRLQWGIVQMVMGNLTKFDSSWLMMACH